MQLNDLEESKSAIIDEICVNNNIKRRLLDLGFVKNARIEKVFSSVYNEPMVYKINNWILALRKEDSSKIGVHYE